MSLPSLCEDLRPIHWSHSVAFNPKEGLGRGSWALTSAPESLSGWGWSWGLAPPCGGGLPYKPKNAAPRWDGQLVAGVCRAEKDWPRPGPLNPISGPSADHHWAVAPAVESVMGHRTNCLPREGEASPGAGAFDCGLGVRRGWGLPAPISSCQ